MKNFYDKEYHPVIENFIADFADDNLQLDEREAFEEVLVYDDDLRELAHSSKLGKALLKQFSVVVKADKDFEKRLAARIARSN